MNGRIDIKLSRAFGQSIHITNVQSVEITLPAEDATKAHLKLNYSNDHYTFIDIPISQLIDILRIVIEANK